MQFFVGFTAVENYALNGAHTIFRLGYPNQTIQIGGFSLVNYGKSVTLDQLPTTTVHYAGETLDAPWRAEADLRIEAIRKGNLTITVQDSAGQPVVGATVAVKMKRHAFGFGFCDGFAFHEDWSGGVGGALPTRNGSNCSTP